MKISEPVWTEQCTNMHKSRDDNYLGCFNRAAHYDVRECEDRCVTVCGSVFSEGVVPLQTVLS